MKKWIGMVLFYVIAIVVSSTLLQMVATSMSLFDYHFQDVHDHQVVTIETSSRVFDIQPRAFPRWNSGRLPLPCTPFDNEKTPSPTGFLLVRPQKCGSSTAAGVTLRIASRVAQSRLSRSTKSKLCQYRGLRHEWAGKGLEISLRNRNESVLWSLVRDPTRRAISEFFHIAVSRRRQPTTDERFQKHVKNLQDFLVKRLYPDQVYNRTAQPISTTINRILDSYDFIGVTERMDESLVALQLILGLETKDIVHFSAKVSGGYDDGLGTPYKNCTLIQPSFVSEGMREFFDSSFWTNVKRNDELLHQAVNRSLDLTIQNFGRDIFDEAMQKYQRMQAQANQACEGKVRMPCDSNGTRNKRTDCILWDSGCGFDCIDRALDNNAKLEK